MQSGSGVVPLVNELLRIHFYIIVCNGSVRLPHGLWYEDSNCEFSSRAMREVYSTHDATTTLLLAHVVNITHDITLGKNVFLAYSHLVPQWQ
jgi:hypothetical protein